METTIAKQVRSVAELAADARRLAAGIVVRIRDPHEKTENGRAPQSNSDTVASFLDRTVDDLSATISILNHVFNECENPDKIAEARQDTQYNPKRTA